MRRALWILGGLALLLLVAAVALPALVDVNQFRPAIQAQLEKRLRRSVTLGPMALKIIPLAVRVNDVSIGEDPAVASGKAFASAKEIDVHVNLFALLRREVQLKSLTLRDPVVELIKTAEGKWNYATLGGDSGGGDSSSELQLSELRIENGTVALTDRAARQQRQTFSPIDLRLRDYAPHRRFALELAARLPGSGNQTVSLEGTGGPAPSTDFTGKVKLQNVTLSGVQGFLHSDALKSIDGAVSGEADINRRSNATAVRGQLNVDNGRINRTDLGYAIKVDADLNHTPDRLQLTKTEVKLGAMKAAIAGWIDTKSTPAVVDLNVNTERASIAELARLAAAFGVLFHPGMQVKGALTARLNMRGPAANPELAGVLNASALEVIAKEWREPVRVPELAVELSPEALRSREFTVQSGPTALAMSVSISDYSRPSAAIDARVRTDNAQVAELLKIANAFGGTTLDGVSGTGTLSLNAQAKGPLKNANALQLSGSGALHDGSLKLPSFTQPLRIKQSKFRLDMNSAGVEELSASLGSSNLSGRAAVRNFEKPEVTFDLAADKIDAAEIQKITANQPQSQSAPGKSSTLSATGRIAIGLLKLQALELNRVRAACALSGGILRLAPIEADLYNGKHSGAITVDLRGANPSVAASMKLEKVDANRLLSATTSVREKLFGLLAADGQTNFSVEPNREIAQSLNGEMRLDLSQGKLVGMDIVNEMAGIARFAGLRRSGQVFTDIVKLAGTVRVKNGVAETNDLKLEFAGGTLAASGLVNLVDQSLNMRISTVLGRELSERAGGNRVGGYMVTALANSRGELVVPALVTGTFASPKFAPDAATFARMKAESVLPSTGGVIDAIRGKKGAAGILEALKPQPRQQQSQPPAGGEPTAQPQAQPAHPAQQGIGGLIDLLKKKGKKPAEEKKQP